MSSEKPISKDYLLTQLKNLDKDILEKKYANINDIPTELPANGGNADTVNNHTVASDVPEDAVFTDTIYDDTEIQNKISEQKSNLTTLINEKTKITDKYISKPRILECTNPTDIGKNDIFTGLSTSTSIYITNDSSYTSSYTDAITIVTKTDLEYLKNNFNTATLGKYISYRSSSGDLTEYNCTENENIIIQYGVLSISSAGNIIIDGIYPKELTNYGFPEIDGEITVQDILSDYIEDKIYIDVAVKGKTISMLDYNNYKTHYNLISSSGKEQIITSTDDQTILVDFLPISENLKYFISNAQVRTLFLYDENKDFLSVKNISTPPIYLTKTDFESSNSKAAYFRFYFTYRQNAQYQIMPNS